MDPVEYLMTLVSAYNPNQYDRLVDRPAKHLLVFLGILIAFSLLLFTAITVPVTYHYISTIPDRTAEVEQLQLSADVTADHQVVVLDNPRVVLDTSENVTRTAPIMLTNEGVIFPKYVFFGTGVMKWEEIRDLKQQTPQRDRLLGGIIIFLLPSMIFWFFLLSMLLIGIFFLLLTFLGWALPRIFKYHISYQDSCKLGIIAIPSTLLLTFGLFPLGVATIFWTGVILTTALFGVGVAILSDIKLPEERPKRQGKI